MVGIEVKFGAGTLADHLEQTKQIDLTFQRQIR